MIRRTSLLQIFKYLLQNDINVPIDESLESDWAREVVGFL